MHTIKLEIGDSVYSHIMFLLKNLKSNELRIIEVDKDSNNLKSTDDLETKIFSNYSATLVKEWKDTAEDEVWK